MRPGFRWLPPDLYAEPVHHSPPDHDRVHADRLIALKRIGLLPVKGRSIRADCRPSATNRASVSAFLDFEDLGVQDLAGEAREFGGLARN